MKKSIHILVMLMYALVLTVGCKKDKAINPAAQVINVTMKVNEPYQYDLGSFGDEEGVNISKQALHYQVSITKRINFDNVVYTYTPEQNFIGSDLVELKIERASNETSQNTKTKRLAIKFTITN